MWEEGLGGLHEQEGSPHVDVVLPCEFGGVDFGDAPVLRDAGVVDEDVDLEFARLGVREAVLGYFDHVRGTGLGAHIGLDSDGFD